MRYVTRFFIAILGVLAVAAAPQAQQAPAAAPSLSLPQFIERMVKAEAELTARLASYHPVVEVYLQSLQPTDDPRLGPVPTRDDYYVGRFDATNGPDVDPLADARGWFRAPGLLNRVFGVTYVPSGFASTTVIDRQAFDTTRYDFTFVRREFLDEVRTVVFEVRPKGLDGAGFMGRIWVDDRDFTIVRFNGISREVNTALSRFFRSQLSFHLDSWRVNVQPGVWVPGYVYFEETDFNETRPTPRQLPKLKGQMRLWGYEATDSNAPSAFASIEIGDAVRDSTEPVRQIAPVLSQRSWEMQAENNVLERLTRAGLLAPPGPVNQVLETVLNNLLVTNELNFDPPLRVRVLLTTPLESFTVGRTIVLSRGLIDVLPDEASLGMVLAHELAHVALGHLLIDTKFGFADRLMIPDAEVIGTLRFQHTPANEAEADAKLLELLGKSPYADRLTNAGLFLQQIVLHARELRNLVLPHVGDYVVDGADALGQLVTKAPSLAPAQVDQMAALPLGARLTLDPWNNQLELIRTPTVPLVWAREKLPLAITPMVPYLRYTGSSPRNSTR